MLGFSLAQAQIAAIQIGVAIVALRRPKKGSTVKWRYGSSTAEGTVERIVSDRVEIKSGESTIVRNGTEDDPVVVIRQGNNENRILKLLSELL